MHVIYFESDKKSSKLYFSIVLTTILVYRVNLENSPPTRVEYNNLLHFQFFGGGEGGVKTDHRDLDTVVTNLKRKRIR